MSSSVKVYMLLRKREFLILYVLSALSVYHVPAYADDGIYETNEVLGAIADSGLNLDTVPRITYDSFSGLNYYGGFMYSDKISHISIPDGIDVVEYKAFLGCNTLESAIFPKNLKSIDRMAFKDCHSLQEISIPDNVKIGSCAFKNCFSLERVTLGKGVIIDDAFPGCYSLTHIDLKKITNEALPIGCFADCINLRNVVLPTGIKDIGSSAFAGCRSLQSIELPEGL